MTLKLKWLTDGSQLSCRVFSWDKIFQCGAEERFTESPSLSSPQAWCICTRGCVCSAGFRDGCVRVAVAFWPPMRRSQNIALNAVFQQSFASNDSFMKHLFSGCKSLCKNSPAAFAHFIHKVAAVSTTKPTVNLFESLAHAWSSLKWKSSITLTSLLCICLSVYFYST